jgi:hypothetical protein
MDTYGNPFLKDTDDKIVLPEVPKADTKGAGRPGSEHWGKVHSPEKIAADKKLRAEGKVPVGQKAKCGRSKWNEKDFRLVLTVIQFRYLTANQIAMLMGVRYETVNDRIKALQDLGVLDFKEHVAGARMIWFATAAAIDMSEKRSR